MMVGPVPKPVKCCCSATIQRIISRATCWRSLKLCWDEPANVRVGSSIDKVDLGISGHSRDDKIDAPQGIAKLLLIIVVHNSDLVVKSFQVRLCLTNQLESHLQQLQHLKGVIPVLTV